jgi:cysteinyl-tRNA synthetase
MALRVYNTMTGQKEEFIPLEPGKIGLYVCGITPYDMSHLGHARVYVCFDVIQRWLRQGYQVTFVRNYTDIDDKIIQRANERGEDPLKLSAKYIEEYLKDMASLHVQRADIEPKVSETIEEIISFIEALVANGMAYRVPSTSPLEGAGDDVFYRVKKYSKYTALSRRNMEDLLEGAGSRVAVNETKESPLDFALWKSAKPGEPLWNSPFGKGRPGWHIECSAMCEKHLGTSIDIHGGGKDLVFPHHTNEIAQSEAKNPDQPFSRYWLHNGFLNIHDSRLCAVCRKALDDQSEPLKVVYNDACGTAQDLYFDKEECAQAFQEDSEKYLKMSKSLGNFQTIRAVLEGYTGDSLRWLLVQTHYRNPIMFSPQMLEDAERRVMYLYETLRLADRYIKQNPAQPGDDLAKVFGTKDKPFVPWQEFEHAMNDDFATSNAIVPYLELFRIANLLVASREKEQIGRKLKPADRSRLLSEWQALVGKISAILGVAEQDPSTFLLAQRTLRCRAKCIKEADVESLIQARHSARAAKDFAKSDQIRQQLQDLGVELRDTPEGTEWSVSLKPISPRNLPREVTLYHTPLSSFPER